MRLRQENHLNLGDGAYSELRSATALHPGQQRETLFQKKRWPTVSKLEMPGLPWFNVQEEIQRLRAIGIVEWISHFRPPHPSWKGLEDIPLTNSLQNRSVRAARASLKSPIIAFL